MRSTNQLRIWRKSNTFTIPGRYAPDRPSPLLGFVRASVIFRLYRRIGVSFDLVHRRLDRLSLVMARFERFVGFGPALWPLAFDMSDFDRWGAG